MAESVYTIEEIRQTIKYLTPIFDIVRVVNPMDTTVLTFGDDGSVKTDPYTCFQVWKKECRCENCSSMCALTSGQRMSKYEFILNSIFYVISHPVSLVLEDKTVKAVLEIVSRVSDHLLMEKKQAKTVAEFVEEVERKIYRDDLTNVFNRRYFDEYIFLHRNTQDIPKQVAFVVIDLKGFKTINDTFGHMVGDEILQRVALALNKSIRKTDSLIRIGGDEFLLTMIDCDGGELPKKVQQLENAIEQITYGPNGDCTLKADIGYPYTDDYRNTKECTERMLKEADDAMYREKHGK